MQNDLICTGNDSRDAETKGVEMHNVDLKKGGEEELKRGER